MKVWLAAIPRASSASTPAPQFLRRASCSISIPTPTRAMTTSNPTMLEKKALRKEMQTVLGRLSGDALAAQGAAVLGHLEHFDPFVKARRVGCYVSMASAELPTPTIIDSLIRAKKKVFLPFVSFSPAGDGRTPASHMDLLQFNPPPGYSSFSPSHHLVPFKFSNSSHEIFQFDPAVTPALSNALDEGLDLLLLPGVGFDRKGNRLGHGKGYYDRFIRELMERSTGEDSVARKRPVLVGICLHEQVLPSVPCQSHDQPLDYLVSPHGVLSFSQKPSSS